MKHSSAKRYRNVSLPEAGTYHYVDILDSQDMSGYTCISCRVAFADADIQRAHYKTDWHRYNLKRKVAELPPVTAENFQERVLAQRAQAAEKEKDQSGYCDICNKRFSTKNAYDNHIQSKKHKEAEAKSGEKEVEKKNKKNKKELQESVKALEKDAKNMALKESMGGSGQGDPQPGPSAAAEDSDEEMASDEEWDGDCLGIEECLFCSYISESLEGNAKHMLEKHSFFIPDMEYLTDLEGLITYLGEKIGQGKICLWCNEKTKTFLDTKSVQKHMVDKGHCKVSFDGDAMYEYSDYYDYRSSYPDYAGAEGGEDEEMMDHDRVAPLETDGDSYTLVLPSGATVGHRALQRYYRQNLKPERQLMLKNTGAVSRVMAQYKALGWTGCTGVAAQKKAKDQAFLKRHRAKFQMQLGVKANKFQPHFRPQVVF